MTSERRLGRSRLVYDKATRTIVPERTLPMISEREVIARAAETVMFRRIVLGKPIDGYTKEVSEEITDAILTALAESGMMVVKKEPTEGMRQAGSQLVPSRGIYGSATADQRIAEDIYRTMILASTGEKG